MTNRTALYDTHVAQGGKMVDFAGWDMPLHYGSQLAEHHAVRTHAGMFDVSHMTVIDIEGAGALDFLRRLVANDVARLTTVGQAIYGVLLDDGGGVVDDLIVYRRAADYRCVVNAGTRAKVLAWFAAHNDEGVQITERDLAMVAIQGPAALALSEGLLGVAGLDEMKPFSFVEDGECMIARTGYTGEAGVEVILPGDDAVKLWLAAAEAGVVPAGLGARDTLRLEAGLNLYGQDMDESTSPLVSNLAWTIAWEPEARQFIGRKALALERDAGVTHKLTGLVMEGKGILRHGQQTHTDAGDGLITSGIFSPTLGYSIALARIPVAASGAAAVDVRGKRQPVRIVRPPFVRNGQRVYK